MQKIEPLNQESFYLGDWIISPKKNQIKNDLSTQTIQPKLIEVLTFLCSRQNKIISSDDLIKQCWPKQFISDNPVHKCIAQLRKALGDSSKCPKYIATIPKRGYSVIAKVTKIQSSQSNIEPYWLDKAPFVGLKQFKSEQKDIFFGRNKPVSDVLTLVDQIKKDQSCLIMILGQSGCGKSSLVQAGILPNLLHPYKSFHNNYSNSYKFIPITDLPARSFIEFLYKHEIISNKIERDKYFGLLDNDTDPALNTVLTDGLNLSSESHKDQIIIFIDQLEYVFSQNLSNHEIDMFFTIMSMLIKSQKILIISAMRNEYYQELTESHAYLKIKSGAYHYDVPPLRYDDMCDIIRKPIQAAGLMYEMDPVTHVSLDSYLINKAQSSQVTLPILQNTLSELFNNSKGKILRYSVYKKNGGMEGGLSKMAEETFQCLPIESQAKFDELLHNLIQINPYKRHSVRCKKAQIKHLLYNDFKTIITTFTDKRLFQTEWINNESYLSITNDTLIKDWQRLSDWVIKNTTLLNSKHEIKIATNNWLYHSKSDDFLLNAALPIQSANLIKQNDHINLTKDEKDFISTSNAKYLHTKRIKITMMVSLFFSLFLLGYLTLSINSKNNQIMKTKNNAESLISFILFDLKDKLTSLGRIDLLDLVGSKTIDYFSKIEKENLSTTSLNHWVEALQIVGEASFTQGEYEKSYNSFLKADEILIKATTQDPNNIDIAENHMLGNYWLGYLNLIKKDYHNSSVYWKKYLLLAQNLSKQQPEKHKWQLETSYAFNNLGTLSVYTKEYNLANEYFNSSISLKKQLLEKSPQDQVLIADLADSISWLGKVKEKKGDLIQRMEINLLSLDLSRKLIKLNPNNPQWRHRLSIALHRLAFSQYDLGDLKQAKTNVAESIDTLQVLVENDKDNFTIKKELIFNYLLMAKIYRHQGDNDKGLFYIQKSQDLLDVFKTNLKYTKKIASYHINLIIEQSIIMNRLNQNQSALQAIQKAEMLWQDYFSKELNVINNEAAQVDLALININKFSILNSINYDKKNNELLIPRLNILKPFINNNPNHYKTMALYLKILKYTNNLGSDKKLEDKLKLAEYRNPDFTPIDSEKI